MPQRCAQHVSGATATVTALVDLIGYEAAQQVARRAREMNLPIRQVVLEQLLLDADRAIAPDAVTQLGSRRDASEQGRE